MRAGRLLPLMALVVTAACGAEDPGRSNATTADTAVDFTMSPASTEPASPTTDEPTATAPVITEPISAPQLTAPATTSPATTSPASEPDALLPVDGTFGPATATAVDDFRAARFGRARSTVGPDTWAELGAMSTIIDTHTGTSIELPGRIALEVVFDDPSPHE